jgi:hypothetical protein
MINPERRQWKDMKTEGTDPISTFLGLLWNKGKMEDFYRI